MDGPHDQCDYGGGGDGIHRRHQLRRADRAAYPAHSARSRQSVPDSRQRAPGRNAAERCRSYCASVPPACRIADWHRDRGCGGACFHFAAANPRVPFMRLRANNLTFRAGGRALIEGATASFEPGRLHLIVGANGAGKSTLIKRLTRLIDRKRPRLTYTNITVV